MKLDLDLKRQNLICKAIFRCKSNGNSILKVKSYVKTVNVRINKISIIISNHVDKVYVRSNKVFDKIKGMSKKARN